MKHACQRFIILLLMVSLIMPSGLGVLSPAVVQAAEKTKEIVTQKELASMGYKIPVAENSKISMKDAEMQIAYGSGDKSISSKYVDVAVSESGRFTIGTIEGSPNYTSDNNRKLLYGHPSPGTSETLIKIGENELFFQADSIVVEDNKVFAYMNINEFGIQVVEILEIVKNESGLENVVKISYRVHNTGSSERSVGIRIMLDTMIASNDDAPFKIPGSGNVIKRKSYSGTQIPKTYQVYDDLDEPTTIATGILYTTGEKKPNRVLFTNWRDAEDSAWDYDHDEGASLGDSAVVIYYNPVEMKRGASYGVSTYYGAGDGGSVLGDDIISLTKRQIGIRVKNNATDLPVQGASVTVKNPESGESATMLTNASGVAVFDNATELQGNCKVTITKDGYGDRTETKVLACRKLYNLYLKPVGDNSPMIDTVTLDSNKNLLTETAVYCENTDDVPVKPSNSKVKKLKITSDVEGSVYQLLQDGEVVMNSTTGEFYLTEIWKNKRGKSYTKPRIQDFSAGKPIYALAIGPDGSKSKKVRLGLKVKEPSSGSIKQTGTVSLGSKVSVSLNPDDMNAVEKFFLGDSSFEMGVDSFPLKAEVDEDGKVKIMINKTEDEEDFEEKIEEAKKNYKKLDSMNSKKLRVAAPFTFDYYAAGYGEGYIKDGSAMINVDILCYLKGEKSWTTYFLIMSFPCYVKTTVEGKLQVEIGANAHNQNGWQFEFTKGDINPSVTGAVELGAGISGVLSASVEGSGDIAYLYSLPNDYYKLSTTLQAKIKGKAFLMDYSRTIAKYTVVWTDGYADEESCTEAAESPAPFAMEDLYNEDNYKQMDRSYLQMKAPPESLGGTGSSHLGTNYVQYGAFPNAMPQVVACNGNYYSFWIEDADSVTDAEDRNAENRTVLVYSKYDEEAEEWHGASVINDDLTADFNFDVAVDGSDIYVVWQNMNKVFNQGEGETISDYMEAADVAAAKLNTLNNTITTYQVPSTNKSDISPKIVTKNGNVVIAWYSMDRDDVFGMEDTCKVHIAKLTGSTFAMESEKTIQEGLFMDFDLGFIGDKETIAYGIDKNRDLTDNEDREIYYLQDGKTSALTNNTIADSGARFIRQGTKDVLYWHQNGSVGVTEDLQSISYIQSKNNVPISENFNVMVNKDGTAQKMIWTTFGQEYQEEKEKAVYAIDYENKEWSAAYEVIAVDEGELSNPYGVFDENGKEIIVLQKTQYYENVEGSEDDEDYDYVQDNISELISSEILSITPEENKKLLVQDITYDRMAAAAGASLPIDIEVQNTGNERIDRVSVSIGYDHTEEYSLQLPPGETTTLSIRDYIVPDYEGPEWYEISLDSAEDEWVEIDYEEELSRDISTGFTEIRVKERGKEILDEKEYLTIDVENISATDAEEVNVKLIADEEDGHILYDQNIGTLEAGESKTIYYQMEEAGDVETLWARVSTDTEECYEDNNLKMIPLVKEVGDIECDVAVSFESENDEQGSVHHGAGRSNGESIFENGTEIDLTAIPAEGYVFKGWKEETEAEIPGYFQNVNQSQTTYVVPNSPAKVIACFAKANHATGIEDDNLQREANIGDRFKLTPVLKAEGDGPCTDYIAWESSDTNVAEVEDGNVIINGEGNSTVTATVMKRTTQGEAATAYRLEYTIIGTLPKITSLGMTEREVLLEGIETEYDMAQHLFKAPMDGVGELIWNSSNPSVAMVEDDGYVTTKNVGSTTISVHLADDPTISAACQVKVTNPITGIALDNLSKALSRGQRAVLTASVFPADHTDEDLDLQWISTDTSVAKVVSTNGLTATIEAVGAGTASIIAKAGDFSVFCHVQVTSPAQSLALGKSSITINRNEVYKLSYTVTPSDCDEDIIWSSSNGSIASVDSTGYVTGHKAGTATITAKTEKTGKTAKCTVRVSPYLGTLMIPTDTVKKAVISWKSLESAHPYASNSRILWNYTKTGAKQIKIHFNTASLLENNYDEIYVLDGSNHIVEKFTGDQLAGTWVTVSGNTLRLYLETDYSVTKYGFKVDNATVTMVPKKKITGVKVSGKTVTYNGKKHTIKVKGLPTGAKIAYKTSSKGTYKKTKPTRTKAGTTTVYYKITKTNYQTLTGKVKIVVKKRSLSKVKLSKKTYTYNGKAKKPKVIVKNSAGKILKKGTHYKVTYKNNRKVGKATVIVKGNGNYKGTIKKSFYIKRK